MQSFTLHRVAYIHQFMNTVRAQCINVTCRKVRTESIYILTFQAMHSANQISITTCSMADENVIEAARCFPCLWQVSSKCYKDARARENAWKEVASQVTEQTANRKNTLLSSYFEYRTHPYCSSSFLLPSLSSVKQSKQQHFSLYDEGGVYGTLFI